jgi:DNA polymerase-1
METLVLIDGNSLMFRAYYATAYCGNLMKTSQGIYTNALHGFVNMMNKVMSGYGHSHMLVAFDAGKTTFRHEFLDTYKDGRKPMPDELRAQINLIKKYLDLLGVKRMELPTYEADDIIGTLACRGEDAGFKKIHIITGDKDLLQMASEQTTVHITRKGVTEIDSFTPEAVMERFEMTPKQIIDLKGLMGDASDNLPGIPGVGEKTAIKLIKEYGSVEGLLENTDKLKGKMKEKVESHKEQALLCKRMATIHCDVPELPGFEQLQYEGPDVKGMTEFFKEMEFNTFLKNLLMNQPQLPKAEKAVAEVIVIEDSELLAAKEYLPSAIHVIIFFKNLHMDR